MGKLKAAVIGGGRQRKLETVAALARRMFAKALRTIPVILDICKDIEEYAPNAWLMPLSQVLLHARRDSGGRAQECKGGQGHQSGTGNEG